MTYRIIEDSKEFEKFIEWLPELEDGEQFYYSLFARSKYDTSGLMKSDKSQLARGVSCKDRLYNKIKKLEVKKGTYDIKGISIPQNTLALYIHPNPRSMKKASLLTARMILDNIGKDRYQNPKSISLNALQVSKSRTIVVDFDFDVANLDYDGHIKDIAYETLGNDECYKIVRTRGGYHILIDPTKTTEKNWHQNISKNKLVDQSGDLLLPVPGCVQGGFVPKFI